MDNISHLYQIRNIKVCLLKEKYIFQLN